MIIDSYTHILPKKYQQGLEKKVTGRDPRLSTVRYAKIVTSLLDLDVRFKVMDAFGEYLQVISIASPPIYDIAPPDVARDLCRTANDELAELVFKHPDRFAGGIACLPMTDVDAAVEEAERAMKDLRLRAVELHSDVAGKPLDAPEFFPLYEKMVDLDRPIFIHPMREATAPDYPGEEMSKYRAWTSIGWPYATGLAMVRLVYGGVMEKFPDLRFITHHCGGIIPYLIGRLDWSYDFNEMRMGYRDVYLKHKPIEYFKRFYYDTAVNGNTPALNCGLALAGIDHMVFATDLPFDNQNGLRLIRDTIESVEAMELSAGDKKKVYSGDAISLLRLPFCALKV